jgi:hypothetical protein
MLEVFAVRLHGGPDWIVFESMEELRGALDDAPLADS